MPWRSSPSSRLEALPRTGNSRATYLFLRGGAALVAGVGVSGSSGNGYPSAEACSHQERSAGLSSATSPSGSSVSSLREECGGRGPVWSPRGDELFYLNLEGRTMELIVVLDWLEELSRLLASEG